MEELTEYVPEIVAAAFTEEERDWVESNFPALAGDQPETFCSGFDSLDSIRFLELNTVALSGIKKEFDCAALWHQSRGREELATKYAVRAENVRQVLKEQLN